MMNENLKPCPFCGKEAVCRETAHGHCGNGEFIVKFFIGCDDCRVGFAHESHFQLKGSEITFTVDGHREARERWNRRIENG